MKNFAIILTSILLAHCVIFNSFADPAENKTRKTLTCRVSPELTSISLGLGYLGGEGKLFCDDGSSASLELSGFQMLNVGITLTDKGKSDIVFSGIRFIKDIEGVYYGVGAQLSTGVIVNADFGIYTNGEATMKWASPASGIEIGTHYRAISIELSDVTPPLKDFETVSNILRSLKMVGNQLGLKFFLDPQLPDTFQNTLQKEMLLKKLKVELEREDILFDDLIWGAYHSDLGDLFAGSDVPLPPDLQPLPFLFSPLVAYNHGLFQPGQTYVLSVTLDLTPSIQFKYKFTLQEELGRKEKEIVLTQIERKLAN